jgi:Zn-dependent peptidase ImmA (M78 family)
VRKMSLRAVIEGAGLSLYACASTLGVDYEIFQNWADGKREMPPSYTAVLAAVLGVKQEALTSKALSATRGASKSEPPAIWFKLRGTQFTDADRESILLLRRLGHNTNQFERAVEGHPNRSWYSLFRDILENVDVQASPQSQGRIAAQLFCGLTQFGSGGKGSSEILRGNLRAKGILIIESPIPQSQIEGCSFLVGDAASQRPCIFVNTFGTTWFRRNVIIMHELAHSLFDQNSGVEIDTVQSDADSYGPDKELTEARAESFARECLLPKKLILSFCSQNGVKANFLTAKSLAALVAFSGVEKKTVVEILRQNEFIDDDLATQYQSFDIADDLRELSVHALNTAEYINFVGLEVASSWLNKRFTTIASRKLLLPVAYVMSIVEAVKVFKISIGRACELLMIDTETFNTRFADVVCEVSE